MLSFIKHLLIPHEKNNHRAGLLHNSSLLALLIVTIALSFFVNFLSSARPDVLGMSYSISESELLALVNQARVERGLPALSLNSQLSDASRRKAADMLEKNYWAHFPPDGSSSPWGFIRASGYSYVHAGENLAKGFSDSGSVVSAWMNSPTHRDNILSSKYNDVGFAIVPGILEGEDTVLIVEMFGSTTVASVAQPVETASAAEVVQNPIPKVTISPTPAIIVAVQDLDTSTVSGVVKNVPSIDAAGTSKTVSTLGLTMLAFAFTMDLVIVKRKKIPRIVGHNLDHIMLILMFLLFLVLQQTGFIL